MTKKSKTSILIEKILLLIGNKKVYATETNAIKYLKKRRRKNSKRYKLPKIYFTLAKRKTFDNSPFDNFDYYVIPGGEKIILYLHGGAFVNRPLVFHWAFLKEINQLTNATIYVPIYPLAPKYNFRQTYVALENLYKKLINEYDPKNITIMGDSAGASLSLGLTHLLKEEKLPLPKRLITLSPSMDVTFSNPQIANYEKHDPMLASIGCRYVCNVWARGSNFAEPLVSPKYIDFNGFPNTYLFYGTREILCSDLRDFVKQSKKFNFKLFVLEKPKMNHVYPLFPIPEAHEAKKIIATIINE